jgi:hypothetical protein
VSFPAGFEQADDGPDGLPQSEYTASSHVGAGSPHGYRFPAEPFLAAYSHSASLHNRPPAQPQNARDWFQSTQTTGSSSAPCPHCAAVHVPAVTHAAYWHTVTSVRLIPNPGTVTPCTGVASVSSVAPIWNDPPGIVTQATAEQLQAVPVHPLVHVCAKLPCTPQLSYQYRFPPEHAL